MRGGGRAATADTVTAPLWSYRFDDYVSATSWAPDGSRLAAGSLAGPSVLLDATTGEVVASLSDHEMGVLAAGWSASGDHLAVGGQDGRLRLYSSGGAQVAALAFDEWVGALEWCPTGEQVAVAAGRTVAVVEPDGTIVETYPDQFSTVTSLAWSTDGSRLGVGCYGGVEWFEPGSGPLPTRRFEWKGSVLSLAMAPSGKWLVSGNQDNSVHLWRLWSGDDLQMSGYPAKVEHLAWDATSRWLAVGSLGELTIWDFSGKGPAGTRPKQLDAHERHISAVAYQHAGTLLASGAADATVALWDPTRSKTPVTRFEVTGGVSTIGWSPDDRAMAVGTAGGEVAVIGGSW